MCRFVQATGLALVALLLAFRSLQAGITAAEYYIGTDPGTGAATALTIESTVGAAALTEAITLATSTLAEGTHDIGVRVQDSNGNWSNTLLRRITVQDNAFELAGGLDKSGTAEQAPLDFNQTTAAEYFIGSDPGTGAATALTIESTVGAAALTEAITLATSTLAEGTHDVGVRVQDSNGSWSNTLLRRITVYGGAEITATEQAVAAGSIDYDSPEATQVWMLRPSGSIIGESYTLTIEGETIRIDTRYGETRNGLISRIVSAINGNPRIGSTYTALARGSEGFRLQALAAGQASEEAVITSNNLESEILTQGSLGSSGRRVVAAEYFVNDDPGAGNAIALSLVDGTDAYAKLIEEAAIDVSELRAGNHRIGIRLKNSAGKWGLPAYRSMRSFSLLGGEDTTPPTISLSGGSAVSVPFEGNYTEPGYSATDDIDGDLTAGVVVEGVVDTQIPGEQSITYRITDSAGNLATSLRTVYVTDNQAPLIAGETQVTYSAPPATINLFDGLSVTDTEFGNLDYALRIQTSDIDWLRAGNYSVTFEVEDPAGNASEFTRTYSLGEAAIYYPNFERWINGRADPLNMASVARAAAADPDGDGRSNYEEWYADTDPFDRYSFMDMTYERDGSELSLFWTGLLRNQYWIESSSDLTAWEPYTDKVDIDEGANFEVQVDMADPTQSNVFYRLATEPRLPIE
jgi:hypothetical protein